MGKNGLKHHPPHQHPDPLRVHYIALSPQPGRHPAAPKIRRLGELLVESSHEPQALFISPLGR